jgi:tetratricopeptide (TPR) repeat protein
MRIVVLLSLFLHFTTSLIAQADSILAFPKEQQEIRLMEWISKTWKSGPEVARPYFDVIIKELEQKEGRDLYKMAWSFAEEYRMSHLRPDEDPVDLGNRAIEFAKNKKWKDVEAECKLRLGRTLFLNGKYGLGMEWMIKGKEEIALTGWSNPFIARVGYAGLGDTFYKFGDYRTAINYLLAAEKYNTSPESPAYEYGNLNTLGLAYQKLMMYDSAIYYLKMTNEYGKARQDSFWIALTNGNLGLIYFKAGDLDKAAELLKSDYEGSIRSGIYGSAVNAGTLLANIELQRGHTDRIAEYIHFARSHMDTSNLEGMSGYMNNMYIYSKLTGNYRNAVAYADSLKIYQDRLNQKLNQNMLEQAKMKVQVDKYDADVKLLEAAKSRQIILRNALFVILVLSSLVGLLWVKRIQLKRQAAVEKLASAQKELNVYTRSLFEKNQLIQSFTEELDKIKSDSGLNEKDRSAHISALLQQNIFTDDDWRHFRQLFDEVYPGYLVRLKEKFNDLTPAETRLLALTKLQLPGKDMAGMLGISAESIRKTRYRLRKKLNLPEEGSLEEIVSMI